MKARMRANKKRINTRRLNCLRSAGMGEAHIGFQQQNASNTYQECIKEMTDNSVTKINNTPTKIQNVNKQYDRDHTTQRFQTLLLSHRQQETNKQTKTIKIPHKVSITVCVIRGILTAKHSISSKITYKQDVSRERVQNPCFKKSMVTTKNNVVWILCQRPSYIVICCFFALLLFTSSTISLVLCFIVQYVFSIHFKSLTWFCMVMRMYNIACRTYD